MHLFRAMNTDIKTYGLSAKINGQVESWFQFVEQTLSRFRMDSELSQLNQNQGKPFLASSLLFEILNRAHSYYLQTNGLFNPFLGHVLSDLGYNRSFETLSEVYLAEKKRQNLLSQTPVNIDPRMRSITLSSDVCIDLGGIAKGWSAQYLSQMLREDGVQDGAIDAGGDIVFWGNQGDWEIGIENPFQPNEDLALLKISREAGIATSSTLRRSWKDSTGKSFNHIIDPRSANSSESDLVQVSVIAPDLTTAEVYAKCVLILGSEKGITWLEREQPNLAVIALLKDGSVVLGSALESYGLKGGGDFGRVS